MATSAADRSTTPFSRAPYIRVRRLLPTHCLAISPPPPPPPPLPRRRAPGNRRRPPTPPSWARTAHRQPTTGLSSVKAPARARPYATVEKRSVFRLLRRAPTGEDAGGGPRTTNPPLSSSVAFGRVAPRAGPPSDSVGAASAAGHKGRVPPLCPEGERSAAASEKAAGQGQDNESPTLPPQARRGRHRPFFLPASRGPRVAVGGEGGGCHRAPRIRVIRSALRPHPTNQPAGHVNPDGSATVSPPPPFPPAHLAASPGAAGFSTPPSSPPREGRHPGGPCLG